MSLLRRANKKRQQDRKSLEIAAQRAKKTLDERGLPFERQEAAIIEKSIKEYATSSRWNDQEQLLELVTEGISGATKAELQSQIENTNKQPVSKAITLAKLWGTYAVAGALLVLASYVVSAVQHPRISSRTALAAEYVENREALDKLVLDDALDVYGVRDREALQATLQINQYNPLPYSIDVLMGPLAVPDLRTEDDTDSITTWLYTTVDPKEKTILEREIRIQLEYGKFKPVGEGAAIRIEQFSGEEINENQTANALALEESLNQYFVGERQ